MALENKIEMVGDLVESAKNFFIDLFRPNMTLEKIADVVSPRLDAVINKYEEEDFKFSAGKFSIKFADKKHFQLAFEMYFQDEEGKWHKCANESDLRDRDLLEEGAWKTIQALKVITFPIEKPQNKGDDVLQKDENLEEYRKNGGQKSLETADDKKSADIPVTTPVEKENVTVPAAKE